MREAIRVHTVTAATDPKLRAKAYDALGVRVYFTPGSDHIEVTVHPPKPQQGPDGGRVSVGGGT